MSTQAWNAHTHIITILTLYIHIDLYALVFMMTVDCLLGSTSGMLWSMSTSFRKNALRLSSRAKVPGGSLGVCSSRDHPKCLCATASSSSAHSPQVLQLDAGLLEQLSYLLRFRIDPVMPGWLHAHSKKWRCCAGAWQTTVADQWSRTAAVCQRCPQVLSTLASAKKGIAMKSSLSEVLPFLGNPSITQMGLMQ